MKIRKRFPKYQIKDLKLMKKLILFGLCMFMLVGIVSAELIYQEDANETSSVLIDCTNFKDGNWDTGVAPASFGTGICYANYTKIDDSTNTTFWEVKDSSDRVNLTIPDSCWSYDNEKLILQASSTYEGGPCLDGKTKVLTPDGYRFIKNLEEGDLVYSYDNKIEISEVNKIIVSNLSNVGNFYYYIFTKSKLIKATWNHKFYNNRDYLMAKNLKIGDKLLNSNLNEERIILILKIPAYGLTYDIMVKENANFFANDILVHNYDVCNAEWFCYNSSGWGRLRASSTSGYSINEEGIHWNTTGEEPPPPTPPQLNITSISKTSILTINKGGMLTISK